MDQLERRLELHQILVNVLGSESVYFQPPASLVMEYPCIVYRRDAKAEQYGDNYLYHGQLRYEVTYIDRDPDADVPSRLAILKHSSFGTHFVTDNLNHDVYEIYY